MSRKKNSLAATRAPKQNNCNSNSDNEDLIRASPSLVLTYALAMPSQIRLLVCSIGNPAPYLNTLHSAGHTVLSTLSQSLSYPPFMRSRIYGNGLISSGSDYTLWQSSSLMNVSGVGVASAWKAFVKEYGLETGLVVIHDEMELELGKVKVRDGAASPKGHNGLKSIKGLMGGVKYTRIGVGIGRPESRDPGVVSGYVLRKMSVGEKGRIEGCVGKVVEELDKLKG